MKNRIGKFYITDCLNPRMRVPEVLAAMEFIPLDVCAASAGKHELMGYSPMFDRLPEGHIVPEYTVTAHALDESRELSIEVELKDKPFKREERYLVIKWSDIHNVPGNEYEKCSTAIRTLQECVGKSRLDSGKPRLECVVVESDWPEYEPTWKAIEQRVKGESNDT